MDSMIVRVRLYYYNEETNYMESIGTSGIRMDYCFMAVNADVFIDSYAEESGGFHLQIKWTGS